MCARSDRHLSLSACSWHARAMRLAQSASATCPCHGASLHPRSRPAPPARDMRPVRWKFATGPLPGDLPVDQLGTQWFLLSI